MISKIGDTIVSGNLDIISNNTEINSDDINIKNNIIILNSKETSNKVSNNIAGLEIERGSSTNYQVVYDETDSELKAGLSNNLKLLSTKEYSDNNISNAEINLNEQIYQNDYINDLPKIGYYQEDTVEMIATYHMNNSHNTSGNNINSFVVTTDNNGQEVMYFIANDGGPSTATNETFQLFKATRASVSQPFSFNNAALEPACFKGKNVNYNNVLCADNEYIIAQLNIDNSGLKYYLINTNFSSDPNNWLSYKDINNMYVTNGYTTYGCKYIKEYDIFVQMVTVGGCNFKSSDCLRIRTYRYSTGTFIKEWILGTPGSIIQISQNTGSFNADKYVADCDSSEALDNNLSAWNRPKFVYFHKQEILYFDSTSLYINYYNTIKTKIQAQRGVKIAFKVPLTILSHNTGIITQLTPKDSLVIGGSWQISDYGGNSIVSYDSYSGYTYINSGNRDSINRNLFRFKDSDQELSKIQNTYQYGTIISNSSNDNAILPPDASLWGKELFGYYTMWDYIFLAGGSKQGTSYIWVKEWREVKGYENQNPKIIEPVPGYYYSVPSIELWTKENAFSVINTDKLAKYYRAEFTTSTQMNLNEYLKTESNDQISFYFEHRKTQSFQRDNNPTLTKTFGTTLVWRNVFYNPLGHYWILFYQNYETNISDNDKARRPYFCIVKTDGTVIPFGQEFYSKLSSSYKGISDRAHNGYPTEFLIIRFGYPIIISKTQMSLHIRYDISGTSGYGFGHVIITFNDNLTDFTMENITSLRLNGFHEKYALGMKGWIYSGPKYGITVQGNDYAFKPLQINLQKRLFSSESSSYISDYKNFLQKGGGATFNYKMYLQSSQGLIAYVPSMPIFLGGYFEVIQNPIAVNLQPNTNNYIYLERDSSTKKLKAYASTTKDIEEGSKQFSRILLARVLTNEANPIETEYYRINTGYNDYTFYHKITIKQTPNQTIHVYTTENGKEIDHTLSFFVKINSNIKYRIEIKPDLWCAAGTLQNISSNGIIDKNLIVSATPAKLISTNYSYTFKMEYVSSINPPIYRFGNNYSATYPDGQNYSGNVTPIDQLGIYTNLDSVIHYQYSKPLPDGIKSVFIKLVCKDGEHFLGHFMRDEFDQYGDVYHSKVLGTQENLDLFKRLYDTKEVFTCVTGIET